METRCVGEEGGRGRLVKGWVRRGQRQAEVRWRRWPDQVRPLQLPGGAGGQVEEATRWSRWRRQLGGQVLQPFHFPPAWLPCDAQLENAPRGNQTQATCLRIIHERLSQREPESEWSEKLITDAAKMLMR